MSIRIMGMGGDDDGDDPLEGLISALAKGGKKQTAPSNPPLREAVIETLREYARTYKVNPWKVGDLVTPRKGLHLRDAGTLHVVLEVLPPHEVHPHFQGNETSSAGYGRRLDVRVLAFSGAGNEWSFIPFWMESWQLEAYDMATDPHYK